MASMKQLEYHFWEPFSQIDEDGIENNSFKLNSQKMSRLSYKDMHLYGLKPNNSYFSVVTCEYCGLVLKPQSLYQHILKRHHVGSISEEPELPIEPPSKKIKLEKKCNDELDMYPHDTPTYQAPVKLESIKSENELLKKKLKDPPRQKQIIPSMHKVQQMKQLPPEVETKIDYNLQNLKVTDTNDRPEAPSKLKVKFKKTDEGTWMVLPG